MKRLYKTFIPSGNHGIVAVGEREEILYDIAVDKRHVAGDRKKSFAARSLNRRMKTADGTQTFSDVGDYLCVKTRANLLKPAAVHVIAGDDDYLIDRIPKRGEQALKKGLAFILEEILLAPARAFCLAAGKDDSRLHSFPAKDFFPAPIALTVPVFCQPRHAGHRHPARHSDSRGILSAAL